MKITWLHMKFVLTFSPDDSQAKLGRTAAEQLLMLALIPSINYTIMISLI